MGRPPDPINKTPFPEVWRTIKQYHQEEWEIRLRPAANLVGYFLFPVGWHWTEYRALTDVDTTLYEQYVRSNSELGFPFKRTRRSPASRRYKAAQKFRKDKVEQHIRKNLVRGEVRYSAGRMKNLHLRNPTAKPLNRDLVREDFEILEIEHSTVGRLLSYQIEVHVDAEELIKDLVGRVETRGADPKYNLLKIERWCRSQLETNSPTLSEQNNLKSTLIKAACDWYAKIYRAPAGDDQVRPIVDRLILEYTSEQ